MTRQDRTDVRISGADNLSKWINESRKGESATYNGACQRAAWRAYEGGLVTLVQRREPDGGVSYIAQRL